ncbi:hypothetical protein [Saccharothrix xinjiangensis]|uniref:Uncharacterized protein n=1 Tax=Saccharothrix xinjiangensis TaxID=204798 RepID=A0ABV9YDM9_9PSEU
MLPAQGIASGLLEEGGDPGASCGRAGLMTGRAFLIFLGAALLTVPLVLVAGFGAWFCAAQFVQPPMAGAVAVGTMVAAFVPACMTAVKFLDRLIE